MCLYFSKAVNDLNDLVNEMSSKVNRIPTKLIRQLRQKDKLASKLNRNCAFNFKETLRKAIYDLNVMSILKRFIPFIKQSQGILIHFGSCLENLLDLDPGICFFTYFIRN